MDTNQTTSTTSTGFFITAGDGKGVVIPPGQRMVKIAEKKIGKGKGKTVAFSIIPFLQPKEFEANFTAVLPMLGELCEELQKDIVTRMQRDGIKAVTLDDISIPACVLEWRNKSFSAETVGAWFDTEVAELLAFQIATVKGWDVETLDAEQTKYLETKTAAYRASYLSTVPKNALLNPHQCAELVRVIDLLELTGPIVSKIREKIEAPKAEQNSLGF